MLHKVERLFRRSCTSHSTGVACEDVARSLTSWKEIASYLGKGVRTVQRWEFEWHLPVHRPHGHKGIVVAHMAELDAWIHPGRRDSMVERNIATDGLTQTLHSTCTRLRADCAELLAKSAELQTRCEALSAESQALGEVLRKLFASNSAKNPRYVPPPAIKVFKNALSVIQDLAAYSTRDWLFGVA